MPMFANQIFKVRVDIFEVGNIAPTSALKTNEDWKIIVSWSFHSKSLTSLNEYKDMFWRLSVFLEPLKLSKKWGN
jgi:HKD family nuclease